MRDEETKQDRLTLERMVLGEYKSAHEIDRYLLFKLAVEALNTQSLAPLVHVYRREFR